MDYDSDYIMTWCGTCKETTEHDFGGCVNCTGTDLVEAENEDSEE